jgi:YegS/Rv2252/BmrU family lipid kinase
VKVAVILNGVSRKKKKFYREILPALQRHVGVTVAETQWSGQAEELAGILGQTHPVIISAGGDGTLHQITNGLIRSNLNEVRLGIIPLGTGNDFARICGYRADGDLLGRRILKNETRLADVGLIRCTGLNGQPVTEYFINASSVGLGPLVVEQLQNSTRWMGPQLTYFSSILIAFFKQKAVFLKCVADGWTWEGRARVIAFANSPAFGHAIYIAPRAQINDGLLNAFIATDMAWPRFLVCLQRIKGGKELKHPNIHYREFTSATLTSDVPVLLEAEGELVGHLPATVQTMAGKVQLV